MNLFIYYKFNRTAIDVIKKIHKEFKFKEELIMEGLNCKERCRLEFLSNGVIENLKDLKKRPKKIVLDGGHNPAGLVLFFLFNFYLI